MEAHEPPTADAVLAALTHRLASPLGAIVNYAYVLPEGHEAGPGILAASARARVILAGARRWLDAVATLAEPPPQAGVALAGAVAASLERRGGDVEVHHGSLPALAVPKRALACLLDEILANAAQAAAPPPARVDLEVGDSPAGWHLTFADRGRGWSPPEAARAFDLFSRCDPGSNAAGMGLVIVATITARLGGGAWGAASPDGGAVIHVVLPGVVDSGPEAQEQGSS